MLYFYIILAVMLCTYSGLIIFLISHLSRTDRAPDSSSMASPAISIVIPFHNEAQNLPGCIDSLLKLQYPGKVEIVFVNDGSRDRSAEILADQFRLRPDVTRVVLFNGNYGQHMAILAGFQATRGDIVVTLDADLQNPPEEICFAGRVHHRAA